MVVSYIVKYLLAYLDESKAGDTNYKLHGAGCLILADTQAAKNMPLVDVHDWK